MDAHAPLAPSASHQWVPCPGSVFMQKQYPGAESEAAQDGTYAHRCGAHILAPEDHPLYEPLDQEMRMAVDTYVRCVKSIAGGHRITVEKLIHASTIHKDCWGTLDARWFDSAANILHIFDFKYGWGIVEPFMNWQKIIYAVGSLEEIKAEHVWLHIIQPRPYHPDGPHRIWKTNASRIWELGAKAKISAEKAMSKEPGLQTGPHCRYCTANYACVAAIEAETYSIDVAEKAMVLSPTPQMIARELFILRRASEMINHRLVAVEQAAIAMDKQGINLPGWERQFTAGRKVWKPGMEKEIRNMADMMGIQVEKTDLITPTQAIDAGMPADIVNMYVDKNSGKEKLVPENMEKYQQIFGGQANE